jgi:SAM-dependent methyltransferase
VVTFWAPKKILVILGKIINSIKERGFLATLTEIRIRFILALRTYVDGSFDRHYGTDTSGLVSLRDLKIDSESKKDGQWYEPTPVPVARYMLTQLQIDHTRYTFIDYGSGKGRILLLASMFPFKKIIGIEFSPELNEIAKKNIKMWKHSDQRCFDIETICIDACEYDPVDGPLVLFFFTPFKPPVAEKVISRIKRNLCQNPRPIQIVYYGTNLAMIELIKSMGLQQRNLNVNRPFEALKKYNGILFLGSG